MSQDNFTNAPSTLLTTHDANWQQGAGGALTTLTIESNALRVASWGPKMHPYLVGSTEGVAELVIKAGTHGSAAAAGPAVDVSDTSTGYYAYFTVISGTDFTRVNVQKNGVGLPNVSGLTIDSTVDMKLKIVRTTQGADKLIEVFINDESTPTLSYLDDGTLGGAVLPDANDGMYLYGNSSTVLMVDDWASTFASLSPTITSVDAELPGSIDVDLGQQNVVIEVADLAQDAADVLLNGESQAIVSQVPNGAGRTITINVTGYIPDGTNTLEVVV